MVSRIVNALKLLWLHIVRFFRHTFKHISFFITFSLVVFSFLVSLFFMLPSIFSRVPVFSYLTETLSLPLSYEFEGKVVFEDAEGNLINQPYTIYIGGFSIDAISGETFTLDFASEPTECFYVVIEYLDQVGNSITITEKIETESLSTFEKVVKVYD